MKKTNQQVYIDSIEEYSKRKGFEYINFVLVTLFIVVICLVAKAAFFENIIIKQNSMYPTIEDNASVTIYKTQNVKRGDIVVIFDQNVNSKMLIKRVVAVGGDTISIDEDGILHISYVNDNNERIHLAVKEKYVNGSNITLEPTYVPFGSIFVLGDNRLISFDSSEFGAIKKDSVVGKVVAIRN